MLTSFLKVIDRIKGFQRWSKQTVGLRGFAKYKIYICYATKKPSNYPYGDNTISSLEHHTWCITHHTSQLHVYLYCLSEMDSKFYLIFGKMKDRSLATPTSEGHCTWQPLHAKRAVGTCLVSSLHLWNILLLIIQAKSLDQFSTWLTKWSSPLNPPEGASSNYMNHMSCLKFGHLWHSSTKNRQPNIAKSVHG